MATALDVRPMALAFSNLSQTEALLANAATAIEKVLETPDVLLDPSSPEAKDMAIGARSFVKSFFDAAQARCPAHVVKASDGLVDMVVDGFHPEQIWEELEVQNVPLRRHLRNAIKKLASAPKGAVDISLSLPTVEEHIDESIEEPRKSKAIAAKQKQKKSGKVAESEDLGEVDGLSCDSEKEDADDDKAGVDQDDGEEQVDSAAGNEPLEDGFFSLEEMNKFADLAEAPGGMRLDEDAEDSDDFDLLEGGDGDDDEETEKMMFSDFFDAPSKGGSSKKESKSDGVDKDREARRAKAMEDFDDEDDIDDDDIDGADEDEDLSDEEKQLEAKIRELQAEGGGEDEDDAEEGEEEGGLSDDEDEGVSGAEAEEDTSSAKGKSLYEMDKRLRALEEEVEKLEEEQLSEKHWSLRGEVSSKQRPLNSLLEVHLDQPMTQLAGSRAGNDVDAVGGIGADNEDDDAPALDNAALPVSFDIESIIKQRVWDELFDDVVRKAELPPAQRPDNPDKDAVETLNFEKSRVGLGDIYAQQYETEMLGNKTEAEQREDREKTATKELFSKVMFKLDQLTNAHFTPRPPTLGASGEQLKKVGALKMEETIPLLMSDAVLKAPEEVRAPRRHARERNELTHEERDAARRLKKQGRKKKLERKVESGELSLAGMRERSAKLQEKNAEAKREKAKIGTVKDAKKRLRSTELLSQAAQNAASGLTRKEAAREERQKKTTSEGALSSKKLKL